MISVTDEITQVHAGITNGCDGCGSREKEKIKSVVIRSKYGGSGVTISLCTDCRKDLAAKLITSC